MTTQQAPTLATRSGSLDRIRGLAIAAMIVDHLVIVTAGPDLVRNTIGRLAMPLFFLIAGHLAHRLTTRHLGILGVGLILPVLVPWIDTPNVLVWWSIGCLLIVATRWAEIPLWVPFVLSLAITANGWDGRVGTGFNPQGLYGLMFLGAILPRATFAWGERLPRWIEGVGRRPLTWYVGHLLALQAAAVGWALVRA